MEFLQKLGSLPIFILMVVVIYFLMIRPQIIQQKNHGNLINNLKKGDKVITQSGIVGTIIQINNNKIIIKSNNTNIEILKNYIVSIEK